MRGEPNRDRRRQLSRPAARHPDRDKGHLRHGGHSHDLPFPHPCRPRSRGGFAHRRAPARGRHRAARQAGDARVRLRRAVLGPAVPAGAQPVEPGPLHRRLVQRLWRRDCRGVALATLGSETGGSIRDPAHFCGIAGIKPNLWPVSRRGVAPLACRSTMRAVAGPRGIAAILLRAMAGHDPGDPASAAQPVGLPAALTGDVLRPEDRRHPALLRRRRACRSDMQSAMRAAIARLGESGRGRRGSPPLASWLTIPPAA